MVGPLTVNITVAGTASEGTDSPAVPMPVVIPDELAYVTIPITPNQDGIEEGDETVEVNLEPPSGCNGPGYSVGIPASAFVYVDDKDFGVDIDADVDRDGTIEDDEDEVGERSTGIILIADKDNVYDDAKEPAKMRKIVLRTTYNNEKIQLVRIGRMKLFHNEAGGPVGLDLFGAKNTIVLDAGMYWIKGSPSPSSSVGRDGLFAARDIPNATSKKWDILGVVNLWVDIKAHNGRNGANKSYSGPPIAHYTSKIKDYFGDTKLGVFRPTQPAQYPGYYMHGRIQFDGIISPSDLLAKKTWPSIPTTPISGGPTGGAMATVDFGFLFRRYVQAKGYGNGIGTPIQIEPDPNDKTQKIYPDGTTTDDSHLIFQDIKPDLDGGKLFISDSDTPGGGVTNKQPFRYFGHLRANYTENVVFDSGKAGIYAPERCSPSLKWSVSLDFARTNQSVAVCIIDKPNEGKGTNEIYIGSNSHLSDLKLSLKKATINSAKTKMGGDKKIKRNAVVGLTVKGSDLTGELILKNSKGTIERKAVFVWLDESNPAHQYSDSKEALAVFDNIPDKASKGWKLFMRNEGGNSNVIKGFEIVD